MLLVMLLSIGILIITVLYKQVQHILETLRYYGMSRDSLGCGLGMEE